MKFKIGTTLCALAFSISAHAAAPEDTLIIKLKDGDVTIALRPDIAPKHVAQIRALD